MAKDVIIVLERLRCIRESDGSGHSEPYIWPVLIRIDDDTLATPALVSVTSPALGNARIVIRDDMQAGQVAVIPGQVGILRARLDDDQDVEQVILAVALWENDETPEKAMSDGYKAFAKELGLAIADNLFKLNPKTTTEAERKLVIDAIKLRLRDKVESAIRNGLTGSQKVRVFFGTLNLDDIVSSDFKSFEKLESQPFSLTFDSDEKPPTNRYAIDGQLRVVRVRVDPCALLAARVREAQQVVTDIENEIRLQQALLLKQPGEKVFILAEIKRIREEDLPPAEEALEAARRALGKCRGRVTGVLEEGGVVAQV